MTALPKQIQPDQLIQGSAEWHDARNQRIGGSDIAPIRSISPYKSPYALMLEKQRQVFEKENANMKFGTAHEAEALKEFITQTGIYVEPKVVINDWRISSADGVGDDCVLEIKVPNKEVFELAKRGIIVSYYYCQLQWNMHEHDKDFGYFFCFQKTWNKETKSWDKDTALVKVERDTFDYHESLYKAKEFYDLWMSGKMPEAEETDHRLMEGEGWEDCAKRLIRIRARLTDLEAEEKACKVELLDMASGFNAIGGGIKLTKSIRKGTVQYGSIPELEDVDLDAYRKESSEVWTINEA